MSTMKPELCLKKGGLLQEEEWIWLQELNQGNEVHVTTQTPGANS